MKIIKKAKILPCECDRCHTIFQPKKRNLDGHASVFCPFCGYVNDVEFAMGDYFLRELQIYLGIGNKKGINDERAD